LMRGMSAYLISKVQLRIFYSESSHTRHWRLMDKSQAENSKSESTNPDVASAKTANQEAQKAVEAVTETETAETTENLGEPQTKTEAGAKEETATAKLKFPFDKWLHCMPILA